ncbi:MAG: glutathione S-transferase family protein [Ectothiorhodospiraceae bacterium]|jgi:glutathione S-transferase
MIRIYGYPMTRGTRATWALEEAGAEYEYEPVNLKQGEGRRSPYVDLNPAGKVPTLVDDGLVLTESMAVCTWIGDRFPDAGLVPEPRTSERAQYNKWCSFVVTELEQPLWTMAKHTFALPERYRVPAVIETAKWEFGVAARVLAAGLGENDYLLGTDFSMADLLASHTLAWARGAGLEAESEALKAYAERCLSRPALARARERENAAVDKA